MDLFVGIDHSLTAFGLAAVPSDWGLDFRQVARVTLTTKTGPHAPRRAALAADAVAWVLWLAQKRGTPLTRVHVAIEGGILNARDINTIRSQERLVGVVEHAFHVAGVEVAIPEQRTIRIAFMGKSASFGRGAGDAAQELLKQAAPVTSAWDEAELDAFLVANYSLSEAGETFVCCAPAVEPAKAKRGKAA